jgi:hypothetical protein
MTVRPSLVVLGWLAANGVLVGVLFGFGESILAELLYLCSTVPLLVFALFVARAARGRRPAQEYVRLPANPGYVGVAAAGLFLIGIGLIFANWIAMVGAAIVIATAFALWRSPGTPEPPMLGEPRD